MLKYLILLIISTFSISSFATSALSQVSHDTPRDTMRSFMSAMQDYKKGLDTNDDQLESRIDDAIRCLNLSKVNTLVQKDVGTKAAIFLKEVIDRIIVIDYSKIPNNKDEKYWRLKSTEIVINQTDDKDQFGAYLFSPSTVDRAQQFYKKVKSLPYLPNSGQGAHYKAPLADKYLPDWAKEKTLGIAHWKWIAVAMSLLIGLILKALTQGIFLITRKLSKAPEDSLRIKSLTMLAKPTGLFIAASYWYAALYLIDIEEKHSIIFRFIINVVFSISFIWLAYKLVDLLGDYLIRVTKKTDNNMDDQLVPMVNKALRLFVIVFGTLLAIQNLGFNVMSIMAGLGLGGLAFALAAKDTAANVFGSITIILDRPFKIGDWIKAGSAEGTVEEIGFRSTRIRTFYNSLVTVPNAQLANLNIDNMGMRTFRRVFFNLGIAYDTPPEKVEAFLEGIKNIIKNNEYTRKDYMQICFRSYGDFSLNMMVYYFFKVPSWDEELLQTQNVNIEILRLAHDLKIEFAFPTQTLHVNQLQSDPNHNNFNLDEIKSVAKDFSANGSEAKPKGLGVFTAPFKD